MGVNRVVLWGALTIFLAQYEQEMSGQVLHFRDRVSQQLAQPKRNTQDNW